MARLLLVLATAVLCAAAAPAHAARRACEEFARDVKATYNFKPSRIKNEAESDARSAAMDRFWEKVKADRKNLLPCLRAALKDPESDPWFRFDGSNLLVSLDPSPASKAEQLRQYTAVDLGEVNLQVWVPTLARLGAEGFDVSAAGERWLAHPNPVYYLPRHGAYKVERFLGALFIYGSMDEAQATPALLKIAGTAGHPGREVALALLLMQATPEARRGLKADNLAGVSPETQATLRARLERLSLIAPREKPRTSREQFLKAFGDASKGEWGAFLSLTREVPDGESDVVAVLGAEDLPLVRKVRRLMIANANPHAAEYYVSFTQILDTMTLRPGAAK
ncbi:MAG: hypothetical protein LC795_13455 [Acidobacteria bacterium]|nr:hypothetical protein [Acidobacteriota bacterium]